MTNLNYHIPALLNETINGLNICPDGIYMDVTFGGGGHSRAILEQLGNNGRLISMDQDMDAYRNQEILAAEGEMSLIGNKKWQFILGNFRYLSNFADFYGISSVNGLLADLGVSFHHFDEAERGFSFRFAGPLDMRMNRQSKHTAADILNTYQEEELAKIFYLYGEMKNARQTARAIVKARQNEGLQRIEQLVPVISPMVKLPKGELGNGKELEIDSRAKKDLARAFQALRIEVNDELGALRDMLVAAKKLLKPNGRIAILTYHSLEDRIVKNFLRSGNLEGKIEKDFYGNIISPFRLIEKGLTASEKEIECNPRARSAKLRVAERTDTE